MIVVLAKQTVKAGKKTELFAHAQKLIAATRAEQGCISYELLDDPFDSGSCMFVERWADKAALDRHLSTQHISEWRKASLPLIEGKSLALYQADEISL